MTVNALDGNHTPLASSLVGDMATTEGAERHIAREQREVFNAALFDVDILQITVEPQEVIITRC